MVGGAAEGTVLCGRFLLRDERIATGAVGRAVLGVGAARTTLATNVATLTDSRTPPSPRQDQDRRGERTTKTGPVASRTGEARGFCE